MKVSLTALLHYGNAAHLNVSSGARGVDHLAALRLHEPYRLQEEHRHLPGHGRVLPPLPSGARRPHRRPDGAGRQSIGNVAKLGDEKRFAAERAVIIRLCINKKPVDLRFCCFAGGCPARCQMA